MFWFEYLSRSVHLSEGIRLLNLVSMSMHGQSSSLLFLVFNNDLIRSHLMRQGFTPVFLSVLTITDLSSSYVHQDEVVPGLCCQIIVKVIQNEKEIQIKIINSEIISYTFLFHGKKQKFCNLLLLKQYVTEIWSKFEVNSTLEFILIPWRWVHTERQIEMTLKNL